MSSDRKGNGAAAREMITFLVGNQEFGIDVMSVREIRVWSPATPIAHAPSYVAGVINLRGAVLPILDFAARLGFPPAQPTTRHAILVAQVGEQVVGLINFDANLDPTSGSSGHSEWPSNRHNYLVDILHPDTHVDTSKRPPMVDPSNKLWRARWNNDGHAHDGTDGDSVASWTYDAVNAAALDQ